MALKTPIVASDVDGIPELVEVNRSAILFSLSNIDKMIEGINTIYSEIKLQKMHTKDIGITFQGKTISKIILSL